MCLRLQVVVLERTREAGKKVLMSGGTRCNVLPLEVDLPVSTHLGVGGVLHNRPAMGDVLESFASLDKLLGLIPGLQFITGDQSHIVGSIGSADADAVCTALPLFGLNPAENPEHFIVACCLFPF